MSNFEQSKPELPIVQYQSESLQLTAMIFDNGLFVNISTNSAFKLGTTAISLPMATRAESSSQREVDNRLRRRGLTTTTVLGARNEVYTKALAEKCSAATGKITYLSLNFAENDESLFSEALQLVENFITGLSKKGLEKALE